MGAECQIGYFEVIQGQRKGPRATVVTLINIKGCLSPVSSLSICKELKEAQQVEIQDKRFQSTRWQQNLILQLTQEIPHRLRAHLQTCPHQVILNTSLRKSGKEYDLRWSETKKLKF